MKIRTTGKLLLSIFFVGITNAHGYTNTNEGESYFSVNTTVVFFLRSVLMLIVTGSNSLGTLSFFKYSFLMLSSLLNNSENILILISKFIMIIVSVVLKDRNV
jgi:hypothetical protein